MKLDQEVCRQNASRMIAASGIISTVTINRTTSSAVPDLKNRQR
jgi:hypothetical protein